MTRFLYFAFFVFVFSPLACATAQMHGVDPVQIGKDLEGPGVEGWIHGAVEDEGLYVFTYRDPQQFFNYLEMSLIAENPQILAQFTTLHRHDKVRIKGHYLPNLSPQKHILVSSLEVLKEYKSDFNVDPYSHQVQLPKDLINLREATFLVHAIASEGHILVLEYRDAVIPIFVKDNGVTKNLYRGDVVQVHFVIQRRPKEPVHLKLDEREREPLKVVQSIVKLHGTEAQNVTGALILFPKSPEIIFNVFAVEEKLPEGLKRQFTIVGEDQNTFTQLRKKLQEAWDRHPQDYINGRNKLVSTKVSIRVSGIFNDVSPSQANPQIFVKDLSSVEILEKP